MIKLIRCVRRKETVAKDEFRQYWTGDERAFLMRQLTTYAHVYKVVLNVTLDISLNQEIKVDYDIEEEPFDAITEIWWEDYNTMDNALKDEDFVKTRRELEIMDEQFMDHKKSPMFFIDEQVIA